MKLTITQNQYNQCNAGYFGNRLSKDQSGKTPKKPNSGIFKGCAQCNMDPEEKALKPAEEAFGKYESKVNGALRSVIQIHPKFYQYDHLKADPDLIPTQDKKLLRRIDKAQQKIEALDKQAKPLLEGLHKGGVDGVEATQLRDGRAVQIFAEGATDLDLHLLRTNFKAIKIVKQANNEWVKKDQKENNPQINSDQSHDNQEETFRSDLRSINRLVKAEQEKRKSIELDKLQEKTNENIEDKSEFVHENQETGNENPLVIQTDYQTPKPQSGDEKTGETHSSDSSVHELTGDENSQVDPLKTQSLFGQQDGLNQTDQQQQNNQN
ncbi:MAG: hypothetical protein V2B13_11530 [Pseudomonadota bacterium]